MPRYYRAVATDLDGTLTQGGPPAPDVLAAIATARADGVRVLLVTGRILAELDAEFPGLAQQFDAVVAENGAVLATAGHVRPLCPPLDPRLATRLTEQGVPVRVGHVLLASTTTAAHLALDVIQDLHLDAQLITNRGELMILPAGVTKGTGLVHALNLFGISPHSAIGIGDAENDHALLDACELGVAVANAVDALTAHADLTLTAPDGAGIAELLRGPVLAGASTIHSPRRHLLLGHDQAGDEVTMPAAQTSVLITGPTGTGKSYLAGLLAEQLIRLGYAVLVLDPEGDHVELGMLPNTLVLGSTGRPPTPPELAGLIRHDSSIVLDLSLLAPPEKTKYLAELFTLIHRHRDHTGLPHWIVLDEAQALLGRHSTQHGTRHLVRPEGWGYCLATYQPDELPHRVAATMPWHLTVAQAPSGHATLHHVRTGTRRRFRMATRDTNHARHQHKYTHADLPQERGFHFRTDRQRTGVVAVNLCQFVDYVAHCDPDVLRHHAAGRDFSRWIRDVHRDPPLATRLRRIETHISTGTDAHTAIDTQRRILTDVIRRRYHLNTHS